MINQITENENTQDQFSNAIRELQIGKLLRKANITKSCGVSNNTYYRFFNNASFNWARFLLLLSAKVTSTLAPLPDRNE